MNVDEAVRQLVRDRPGANFLSFDYDARATRVGTAIYKSAGISASYVLLGRNARIVVNTGTGAEAPHHKRLFDELGNTDTPYIVTTQAHTDHVGGVSHFRGVGSAYVAQANNPECQRLDAQLAGLRRRFGAPWFAAVRESARRLGDIELAHSGTAVAPPPAGERADLGPLQDRPQPDTTFDDHLRLEIDGVHIDLFATPGGETTDSCIVWHGESSTCLIGNLLGPLFPHFPNFNTLRGDRYRDPARYLSSLNRLRGLGAETILTGRGAPLTGRPMLDAVLQRLHDAVEYVYETTLSAISDGQDLAEMMAAIRLPDSLYVGQAYGRVTWAVRAIWESQVGWFRQRSTTELYPPDDTAARLALVELAGPDRVAGRARRLLGEDQPLVAIGLAEAVLARDPAHPAARDVLRDAHVMLLDDSTRQNFWLTGWLEAQISGLDSGRQE